MSTRIILSVALLTSVTFCGLTKTSQAQFPPQKSSVEEALKKRSQGTTPKSRAGASEHDRQITEILAGQAKLKGTNFEVLPFKSGKTWNVIRYNIKTGESWINGGTRWMRIKSGPARGVNVHSETRFEVKIIRVADGSVTSIIFNKRNGDTWYRNGIEWVPFTEK